MLLVPADWPLASALTPLVEGAAERLGLAGRLGSLTVVVDAIAADDRGWLRLDGLADAPALTLWLHPDQVLGDRPGHDPARPVARDWVLAPAPTADHVPALADFSIPNAQRFLYQQMTLVCDILDGKLVPAEIPLSLAEAFQEAWLVTIDGRLQREGLPHLSAAERRRRFLRLFSPAGVLTPRHWTIFNGFWDGRIADQAEVLAKVRLLPPLSRRPRW